MPSWLFFLGILFIPDWAHIGLFLSISLLISLEHGRLDVIKIFLAVFFAWAALFADQRGNLGLILPALADDKRGVGEK
jgi:hypothetical protein